MGGLSAGPAPGGMSALQGHPVPPRALLTHRSFFWKQMSNTMRLTKTSPRLRKRNWISVSSGKRDRVAGSCSGHRQLCCAMRQDQELQVPSLVPSPRVAAALTQRCGHQGQAGAVGAASSRGCHDVHLVQGRWLQPPDGEGAEGRIHGGTWGRTGLLVWHNAPTCTAPHSSPHRSLLAGSPVRGPQNSLTLSEKDTGTPGISTQNIEVGQRERSVVLRAALTGHVGDAAGPEDGVAGDEAVLHLHWQRLPAQLGL